MLKKEKESYTFNLDPFLPPCLNTERKKIWNVINSFYFPKIPVMNKSKHQIRKHTRTSLKCVFPFISCFHTKSVNKKKVLLESRHFTQSLYVKWCRRGKNIWGTHSSSEMSSFSCDIMGLTSHLLHNKGNVTAVEQGRLNF